MEYQKNAPATVNDPALTQEVHPLLDRILGAGNVKLVEPSMGGEDFAYFADEVPGFFYRLGDAQAGHDVGRAAHAHLPGGRQRGAGGHPRHVAAPGRLSACMIPKIKLKLLPRCGMKNEGPVVSSFGVDKQGITDAGTVYWNLPPARLIEMAVQRGEAVLAAEGPIVAVTGQHTGRSPNDKFVVKDPATDGDIWWGEVNRPFEREKFDALLARAQEYLKGKDLFVFDGYAGADPRYRINVRVINDDAWRNLFARNMFIREEDPAALADFEPNFTVINVANFSADPERDGTRTSTFILLDLAKRIALIGGTRYAGEIKKSIFSVMNYYLPKQDVLSMHCSANYGATRDDVALFFGLSGTGKTTLSADPNRTLIGDDEHGWSEDGVFNIEGGCYAKVIRLSPEGEPEIYATTRSFGTVLENVVCDPDTRRLDLDSDELTENTRVELSADPAPQRRSRRPGRPSAQRGLPDLRRLRRAAADQPADRGAGDVPLPLRLHGEGGGHRARGDRAEGDLQHLLRLALPAAPSGRLRQDAGREAGRARRPRLAAEHRLDGGPLRRGPADEARLHPPDGDRRADRRARRRRHLDRSDLRPRRAERTSRGCPTSSSIRARPGRAPPTTTPRRPSWPTCSPRTSRSTRARSARR